MRRTFKMSVRREAGRLYSEPHRPSVREVAARLGLGSSTVFRWLKADGLVRSRAEAAEVQGRKMRALRMKRYWSRYTYETD